MYNNCINILFTCSFSIALSSLLSQIHITSLLICAVMILSHSGTSISEQASILLSHSSHSKLPSSYTIFLTRQLSYSQFSKKHTLYLNIQSSILPKLYYSPLLILPPEHIIHLIEVTVFPVLCRQFRHSV